MIYYAIKNTSNNSYYNSIYISTFGELKDATLFNLKDDAGFIIQALANYTGTLNTKVLKVVKVEIKEIEDGHKRND